MPYWIKANFSNVRGEEPFSNLKLLEMFNYISEKEDKL
tara:strand:+ start:166 stop:279 length:114 start_codon:yes stop_codon:yes gene_type:complete